MTNGKKSRKLLLIATVLTIAALASVLVVYAAVTLFTVTGGNVTVTGVTTGTIYYSSSNTAGGPWNTTGLVSSGSWYAELVISSSSTFKGPVTVTWQLQSDKSGTMTNDGSTVTTGVTLTGGTQTIYASPTGITTTGNQDWSLIDATPTTYQVIATVASAP
jgi:hypothetical protein